MLELGAPMNFYTCTCAPARAAMLTCAALRRFLENSLRRRTLRHWVLRCAVGALVPLCTFKSRVYNGKN